MEQIPPADRPVAPSKTFESELLAPSTLGRQWHLKSDSLLICRGMGKEIPVKVIQRIVLPHVSSVFDPLVLFSPFTVMMRLLLTRIWKKHGQTSPENEINFKNLAL